MFQKTSNIKLSPIKEMELRASKIPGVVSLAQGIPSFDTPESIKQKAIEAIEKGRVAKYSLSPGIPELREAIEESLASDGMFYDFDSEIIITAGAIEAITATLITILEPNDEVLIPSPTYTSYQEAIKVAGGKPVFVDLIEEESWAFSIKNFEQKISSHTKAIFFCNPNNPTGTIYTKKQLLTLAELAKKYNLYIITDEVYKDFIYTDEEFFSLAQVPELRKRIIRIFSFSKSHSMTGWRVGFVHSDSTIIKEILKIHDSLITCAPVVSQYAALGALETDENIIDYYNQKYLKRRKLICDRLDNLKNVFSYQKPNSSYFVFPKYNLEKDSKTFSIDLLEKALVTVVPGIAFGPNGEGHVRMSFGRTSDDINKAFDRMEKYFK
jgi:aspartate/methionine/tyrosine aminotransferase